MKQFNLDEYLKDPSRKVVTRDGRSARICCTDRKSEEQPIVVLICSLTEDSEYVGTYGKDGRWSTSGCASELDLFFAPEKHEGWLNLFKDTLGIIYGGSVYTSKDEAKEEEHPTDRGSHVATIKIEWEE